ncbi:unnamed protein product [Cylindrotheca closterium]|uniref:Uncharacterized protein n=1 Tax=Cylindrotheca closterium TaxID=2856 RepID=A0AAD2CUH0_9STRA|nr:unnamed protein product [Cylindrotheca closterium]
MESIIPTAEDLFLIVKEANKSFEKKVVFDTHVIKYGSESEFEPNEVSTLWYTKPEITALQTQVHQARSAIIRGEMTAQDIEKEGDLRGLEAYVSVSRLTHKRKVIAHVLEAQKTIKGNKLAKISHDSTTWHKKIALIHALQDYCDVHDPSLSQGIPEMPGSPPPMAKLPTLKRRPSSSSLSSLHSKRVRRRRLSAE